MDQIFRAVGPVISLVIVAITATMAQRKWGSKVLIWVWIGSAVTITGVIMFWAFYKYGPPNILQELFQHLSIVAFMTAYLFSGVAFASGAVIWIVAASGPLPLKAALEEENYFPFNLPTEKLEDTHGLAGILRRYNELLTRFLTDLDAALTSAPFNPYLSPPRIFVKGFRMYIPSHMRRVAISSNRFKQVPNALASDLAGAATVLAELEMLTTAQLSAVEECHRVNARRVRERTILGWSWKKVAAALTLCSSAVALGWNMVEKIWEVKPSNLRGLVNSETFINWDILTGTDLLSATIRGVIFCGAMFAFFIAVQFVTFSPILRRLQAFEDILTIANAYYKGDSGMGKPRPSQEREP
jgi:hypothetical protein